MQRWISLVVGFLVVSPVLAAEFTVRRIATGLEQPVYVTAPPGDTSRLFIVEANSGGTSGDMIAHIRILNLSGPDIGTINPTPFLEIGGSLEVSELGQMPGRK